MREYVRTPHGDAPSPSRETLTAEYEQLLTDGMRIADEYGRAEGQKRAALARTLDRLFARRVGVLRDLHDALTLDERMPELRVIAERHHAEEVASSVERIAATFTFDRRRPAHVQMNEATAAHARAFKIAASTPELSDSEVAEFDAARRAALEKIGCQFVFGTRAGYSNMLSFVKDDFVIQLTHDVVPAAAGLPNAARISSLTILRYAGGQARGHIVSFVRGKWDARVTDGRVQRCIDQIATVVG
jgi:hypothetical protein